LTTELWTPTGATDHSVAPAGANAETGEQVRSHTFRVSDPTTGKTQKFCILADDTTSQAHLEDMGAQAVDKWLSEVRQQDHKRPPTPEERKEIGAILNEIRTNNLKRRESSTGKIYFRGRR
jgi:hypothetical protein